MITVPVEVYTNSSGGLVTDVAVPRDGIVSFNVSSLVGEKFTIVFKYPSGDVNKTFVVTVLQ
ncbi:hypothetical protein [Sulfuracidifex tepidarius]|uniref:Uncharacterized protein n=1 Tax=Sulfuracidifex tepidarius TaxID=1294262 RepID=A0A510E0J1_9CREN|nr:hypothetical protein [Sulfuracidifex tepidarius]BBG23249.1 hypothetical protein IC006_0533 [Sulfuracidifex tepidarius]BBG25999.1 hypothetical protein IC007_0504 [Sulfuracidifex tepidarius]